MSGEEPPSTDIITLTRYALETFLATTLLLKLYFADMS